MMPSDYLYRKASIRKIPLAGTFELSPVCNFACKMCYVRRTPVQIRESGQRLRDWTEWVSLAEKCKKEGTLYLLLTGGEPFLYPDFRKLYAKLHEMGFIISINSNGTLIDRETVEWLKTMAPSRINITLYGGSAETYQKICGNANGFERTKQAILMLKEAGIPVVINASMIPENAEDLEEIVRFGRGLELNTRVSTYMFPPVRRIREENDSRFTAEESARMYMRKNRCMFEVQECQKYFTSQLESVNKLKKEHETDSEDGNWGTDTEFMKCRAGRSSFWVAWDGSMSACGMLPFPGHQYPFEREFKDCWMELTNAVRSTPVLKGCAGCEKRDVCNPCVAMVYSETGDVNGKSDYLCELADHTIALMKQEVLAFERGKNDEE